MCSGRQPELLARREVAVEAEAELDRHLDRGDRAFLDLERVEQQQVRTMLLEAVADLDDPAVAFGRVLGARDEARLLQAGDRAAPPVLLGAALEVLEEQAVHQ